MTFSQLLDYIDARIKANGNNEITGPIDNDVRKVLANYFQDLIGDLTTLNTPNKTDLVQAINSFSGDFIEKDKGIELRSGKANVQASTQGNSWDAINNAGFFESGALGSLPPFDDTRGAYVISQKAGTSGDYLTLIAVSYDGTEMAIRAKDNGVWGAWNMIGGSADPSLIPFDPILKADKRYLTADSNRYTQSGDINLTVDKTNAIIGGGGRFELDSDGSGIILTTDFSTVNLPSGARIDFNKLTLSAGLYDVKYYWSDEKMKLTFHKIEVFDVDNYCPVTPFNVVEPITLVEVAGISNVSDATIDGSPSHEDFTAIIGNMKQNEFYDIFLEGNTGGNLDASFTVFIDWYQSGVLNDPTSRYEIDIINDSTGADSKQASGSILVPANATVGLTRMRVVKMYGANYATDPCDPGVNYGQVEDYTIEIST